MPRHYVLMLDTRSRYPRSVLLLDTRSLYPKPDRASFGFYSRLGWPRGTNFSSNSISELLLLLLLKAHIRTVPATD